ncbi:hypothetical protein [Tranquillimonas alkanivorans]|uniref:PemK-like, MazF-like toxin of type II toxin-antitoxin system n=1 Tax=Tranquillimonas alkanivorans TaxID=441119 RepID=A0A1I5VXS9_9RHOB|nr:hypothetical protein [Tranquillimonas alkanivorans]SFQ12302.1 hypothetical protein SAMN04488047_13720 [Tranquillimonas alkanivorans]
MPISSLPTWAAAITTGSVILIDFPYSEARRRRKIRPGVVACLDLHRGEVVVAYATSRLDGVEPRKNALLLEAPQDWQPAGLHGPTRVQVDRRVRLALSSRRFLSPDGASPVLGYLSPHHAARVAQTYASLPPLDPEMEMRGVHPSCSPASGRWIGRPRLRSPRRNPIVHS